MAKQNHLPLYGVGPIIVYGEFIFTIIGIVLIKVLNLNFAGFDVCNIPFKIIGVIFIAFGFYLDLSAKLKSKIFEKVAENKLITDGIYGVVRNPVYGGVLLICFGIVLMFNNLLLLIVPLVCWIYVTVFLINTEEKWLKDLYGQEYIDYCRKVNRCIPWFSGKGSQS